MADLLGKVYWIIFVDFSILQGNNVYDSTQFDNKHLVENSLSLQSPDSVAGYSLDSQTIDLPTNVKQWCILFF